MPSRKDDIRLIMDRADQDMLGIYRRYSDAKGFGKEIPDDAKLGIKELLEHLKSCLDYLANDIREKYHPVPSKATDGKASFPFAENTAQLAIEVERKLAPGLGGSCPPLYAYLATLVYDNPDAQWLRNFNRSRNVHTHRGFIGAQVAASKPAMSIGRGIAIIRGTVKNSSMQMMPVQTPDGRVVFPAVYLDGNGDAYFSHPEYLDLGFFDSLIYEFDGVPVPAIEILRESLAGMKTLVKEIQQFL